MKKFGLSLTGRRKFNFLMFPFSKFQITIVKNLMERATFFIMNFKSAIAIKRGLFSNFKNTSRDHYFMGLVAQV